MSAMSAMSAPQSCQSTGKSSKRNAFHLASYKIRAQLCNGKNRFLTKAEVRHFAALRNRVRLGKENKRRNQQEKGNVCVVPIATPEYDEVSQLILPSVHLQQQQQQQRKEDRKILPLGCTHEEMLAAANRLVAVFGMRVQPHKENLPFVRVDLSEDLHPSVNPVQSRNMDSLFDSEAKLFDSEMHSFVMVFLIIGKRNNATCHGNLLILDHKSHEITWYEPAYSDWCGKERYQRAWGLIRKQQENEWKNWRVHFPSDALTKERFCVLYGDRLSTETKPCKGIQMLTNDEDCVFWCLATMCLVHLNPNESCIWHRFCESLLHFHQRASLPSLLLQWMRAFKLQHALI